jgi:hypothetical protein
MKPLGGKTMPKKKANRTKSVMVNLTPAEYKALKRFACGEPLGRTVREILMKKIGKTG